MFRVAQHANAHKEYVAWYQQSQKSSVARTSSGKESTDEFQCRSVTSIVVVSRKKSRSRANWVIISHFKGNGHLETDFPDTSVPICLAWGQRRGRGIGPWRVHVPNHVRELCDGCFKGCSNLRCVTFGSSSSLERIGVSCFEDSGVEEVSIPDSVRELCDECFAGCTKLRRVTFSSLSSLERIGAACFWDIGVEEVCIPDSVRELCAGCFKKCSNLRRVTFGSSSSLERIGVACFTDR